MTTPTAAAAQTTTSSSSSPTWESSSDTNISNISTSTTPKSLNLNDFIKSNYGALQEREREKERAALLGIHNNNGNNNNGSNHNYYHGDASVNTEESSIIHSIVSNSNTTSNYPNAYASSSPNHGYPDKLAAHGWTLRRLALDLSLWCNVFITVTKGVAYLQTFSLSVLAALLDSLLDVVSQLVLNYTEKHSSMQRSSALYPAGASRLEPIGVLTCASLMGMASFEVLKESFETLLLKDSSLQDMSLADGFHSALSMAAIVLLKLFLLWLCNLASTQRQHRRSSQPQNQHAPNTNTNMSNDTDNCTASLAGSTVTDAHTIHNHNNHNSNSHNAKSLQLSSIDPTLEAVAQDHWNDALSNGVSAVALLLALYSSSLWWCDGVGAIVISIYIIHSWYHTGKEQIEHLTGKSAPADFLEELTHLAEHFDERLLVDTCRAYHFGPKFLVELEVVMPMDTLLKESHDLGMELQYEIEAREEVERCFVHIDYESRDYDEHVVSKVPELREHLLRHRTTTHHQHKGFKNSAMSV